MKIGVLLHGFDPLESGAEIAAKNVLKALGRRGDEIHVVTRETPLRKSPAYSPGVYVHGVPPALASPEELTDNRHFLSTAWFAWNAAWRVVALHKEKKFDVLHGHQLAGGCAAWLASRLTGTPFVLTIQKGIGSNDFLPGQSAIREPVMNVFVPVLQFLLWNANFVHTVSTASKVALERLGAKEVVRIPNAVEFNAPVQGPARENRLITVSRLTEKNGLLYLIKALPQILEEHPDARLEVIGYGPLQGQLQKTVEALGVAAAVEFKGHVPNERVNERLAAAAVFVRPSLEEGFGIAFVEAMAIGLPVVGTKVGGITDIVTDRVNGLLVEPLDSQSLALAINELLGNHPLAKKLGANGAKSVRERFDVGKAADAFTTVYKRISARD